MIVILIVLGSIYLCGLLFALTVACMNLTDDSALVRHEARRQVWRAPLWPIDEARRRRREQAADAQQASIERSQRLLEQLDRVQRDQQRTAETWKRADESARDLHEMLRRDDSTSNPT